MILRLLLTPVLLFVAFLLPAGKPRDDEPETADDWNEIGINACYTALGMHK